MGIHRLGQPCGDHAGSAHRRHRGRHHHRRRPAGRGGRGGHRLPVRRRTPTPPRSGPRVSGVPLVIPLAWTWMAWPAWLVAPAPRRRQVARVAVAAVGLAAWDLFLDPQMVAAGYWSWSTVDRFPASHELPGLARSGRAHDDGAAAGRSGRSRHRSGRTPRCSRLYLWTYSSSVLAHAVFLGLPRFRAVGRSRDGAGRDPADDPAGSTVTVLLWVIAGSGGCHNRSTVESTDGCSAGRPSRHPLWTMKSPSCCRCGTRPHRVTPCLRSLLAQRGVPRLTVLVLDDGSTDGTADGRTVDRGDSRVRLLTGAPLPPGWLGKPYACQQLADRTRRAESSSSSTPTWCSPRPAVAAAVGAAGRGRPGQPVPGARGRIRSANAWSSRCCPGHG